MLTRFYKVKRFFKWVGYVNKDIKRKVIMYENKKTTSV